MALKWRQPRDNWRHNDHKRLCLEYGVPLNLSPSSTNAWLSRQDRRDTLCAAFHHAGKAGRIFCLDLGRSPWCKLEQNVGFLWNLWTNRYYGFYIFLRVCCFQLKISTVNFRYGLTMSQSQNLTTFYSPLLFLLQEEEKILKLSRYVCWNQSQNSN